jgi:predicted aspartyl protease
LTLQRVLRSLLLVASLAAGVFALAPASAEAASSCKMARIAELPVRVLHNKLIVDGAINGRYVGILLDTGAAITMIPRPTADRLGLSRQAAPGYRMFGIGGETNAESALVDEFKIGQASVKRRRFLVAGERELGDEVGVILGEDFFYELEVEFDLAHNTVRLFQSKDCDGTSLAYWASGGAGETEIEPVNAPGPRIIVPAQINGKPVRALLDSGAAISVLDRPEAARLGIASGPVVGSASGLGPKAVDFAIVALETFVIGDETIRDTTIELADLWRSSSYTPAGSLLTRRVEASAAMLLGADFLRAHRVLVAHSQRKMYFTYVGGPVFARTEPSKPSASVGPEKQ